MNIFIWNLLYLGWLAIIIWVSLDPSPPAIDLGPLSWDKLQHAGAYFLLTLLGGLSLCQWFRSPGRCWLASAGIAMVIGILVEIAQGLMRAGRFAEWQDAVANALGAVFALALVAAVRSIRSRAS
jgi:VanZ family protein